MKHMDHTEYPKSLRQKTDAALHYIIKDAGEAAKAAQGMESGNEGYYLDEQHYAAMELQRRKKGGTQEPENHFQAGHDHSVAGAGGSPKPKGQVDLKRSTAAKKGWAKKGHGGE